MNQNKKHKNKSSNPLVNGILLHLEHATEHKSGDDQKQALKTTDLPKRFTWYEPLVLLNENFENHSPSWSHHYSALSHDEQQRLFATICCSFRDAGKQTTHIAINAPIQQRLEDDAQKNILRAPTNLKPLFGNFGPAYLSKDGPSQHELDAALWVRTAQLPGIQQIWAPRWTMFSRGNIREKARILGDTQHNLSPFPGFTEADLGQRLNEIDVVDFYVGIGYFAIPYLKRGVRRVFGWELNGWSIEGLRRGCLANGLKCRTYCITKTDPTSLDQIASSVADDISADPDIRCFAFHGDNTSASSILRRLYHLLTNPATQLNVRHCNLGLLPSSSQAYHAARSVLTTTPGWLHIHENVDINTVQIKKVEIQERLPESICQHIEMVKTYAPGIGHFVFDFQIKSVS